MSFGIRRDIGIILLKDNMMCKDEVEVTYTGGYAVFPPELEYVMWILFDRYYSASDGAGDLASISIDGVGTMTYVNKNAVSGKLDTLLSPDLRWILDRFVAERNS
jgi:hypothetical protein